MLEYGIMKPYSNISCFSTTRHGGCGEGAYATFNCTHYCGDHPESVKANLEILAASLPKRPQAFVIPRQTHTTNVRVIKDIPTQETLQDVDAVVTHLKDFCLCVSTADCVPVLLYDTSKEVIAAILAFRSVFRRHHFKRLFHNTPYRPSPTGMNGSDHFFGRIIQ